MPLKGMAMLIDKGLVKKDGKKYVLTETGRELIAERDFQMQRKGN